LQTRFDQTGRIDTIGVLRMGEAKRRRQTMDGQLTRMAACRYRRARIAYLVDPALGEDDRLDFSTLAVDAIRAPNAMRPMGWLKAGTGVREALAGAMGSLAAAGDEIHAFDQDGVLVGSMTRERADAEYPETAPDGLTRAVLEGDEILVHGSIRGGMLADSGAALGDPHGTFSGLARVDASGRFMVMADAPLSLQIAALSDIVDGGGLDDADLQSVSDHLGQVISLHRLVAPGIGTDPGAWIDVDAFMELGSDLARGGGMALPGFTGREIVARELVEALDAARRTDPVWSLGPLLRWPLDAWISRDTPGAGIDWVLADRDMDRVAWEGEAVFPNADAQMVVISPGQHAEIAAARALVGSGEALGDDPKARVARHRDLGLYLALVGHRDGWTFTAWPFEPTVARRADPLMTETLHVDDEAEPPAESDARYTDAAIAELAAISLLDALPVPSRYPDYGVAMLTVAHRRGLGIPDLCSTLARVVREGKADMAFADPEDDEGIVRTGEGIAEREAIAVRAEAFGGDYDEALGAMLRGMVDFDWEEVDLDRDLRLLGDAVRASMTLEALALAVMHIEEGGIDDPADGTDEGRGRAR
jgi:hypothetical protein